VYFIVFDGAITCCLFLSNAVVKILCSLLLFVASLLRRKLSSFVSALRTTSTIQIDKSGLPETFYEYSEARQSNNDVFFCLLMSVGLHTNEDGSHGRTILDPVLIR
jgi:hypothetical protein